MAGMRTRFIAPAVVIALAATAPAARASTTCTWGGTPAAPTGITTQHPGITNDPSPVRMKFEATGDLAGGPGCRGRFEFSGWEAAGSSCAFVSFEGVATGLPGVARFAGVSLGGFAPARLYDKHGNVVGSENAQFLTGADVSDCATPEGMTGNRFSSVIVLF